jgi:hypothetical protein
MEESGMFIDLCPDEWIRIGDVTLTVLEIEGSQIQFALEGVDSVLHIDRKTCREDHGCNLALPVSCL